MLNCNEEERLYFDQSLQKEKYKGIQIISFIPTCPSQLSSEEVKYGTLHKSEVAFIHPRPGLLKVRILAKFAKGGQLKCRRLDAE